MITYHFYHRDSGLLHVKRVTAHVDNLDAALGFARANAPDGYEPISGSYDHECQRIDVDTKTVCEWQPPQPSADHEWDEVTKRWRLNATVVARETARASAIAQISALEAKQDRALRELALGYDGARVRLEALDKQIIELRAAIST